MAVTLTKITATKPGTLTKSYHLDTDGALVKTPGGPLVDGMAENQKSETSGISFVLDDEGRGTGSQWTLRKTAQTGAFYASIKDKDTYTVTYVSLEVQPVSLKVKKIR